MRILLLAFLACLLTSLPTIGTAQEIERIEPPSWWTGFEQGELQLMLYGNNISLLTPATEYPGVSISRVVRVENTNYLFVYLDIAVDAQPGIVDLEFSEGDYSIRRTFELRERSADPGYVRGLDAGDAIYMILPDRFANGEPNNDEFDFLVDKSDRADPYSRHGGDLKGIAEHLDYIADIGFTSVWLSPVLESNVPVDSYHGYSTTDHYTVDPRLGSNEQLAALAASMREKGIGLVMDQVLNHIGSGHWWMDDLPTRDWLNFQDEPVTTSHRRTTNMDPHASEFDRRRQTDGWILESMPDLNQRNPLLADFLVQHSIWWVEYAGLQGIRVPALSYLDKHFTSEWTRRIMREYPAISIVGEEWSELPAVNSYWQKGKQNHDGYSAGVTHLFDFPVQAVFSRTLVSEPTSYSSVWTLLYELIGMDFLYPDPMKLVLFPGNHEMDRIYTQLEENVDLYAMAMAFYTTMRGIPQFYYGDEVLMSHPGTSSHGELRGNFPGGWEGDEVNAFTGEGLTDEQRAAQQLLRQLLTWRKANATVHGGRFMHFVPIRNVYVYFRYDENDTVMVLLNRDDEAVTLETERFAERIGNATHGTDVVSGKRFSVEQSIVVEPRSALVLELEGR
jgi:glycosidase